MNRRNAGFTLIEILVSLALLAAVVVSVFTFYWGALESHEKLQARLVQIRLVREFIEIYSGDMERGPIRKEGFELSWEVIPVEEPRPIISRSGVVSSLQLNLVDVSVRDETEKNVLAHYRFLHCEKKKAR